MATLGGRAAAPAREPEGPAPLHRVVSRWFVASASAGLVATLAGVLCGLAKEGWPRGIDAGEMLLRSAMAVVLVGAALSPLEGLSALARRLGGRRRQLLVGLVCLMPSLGFLVAFGVGLWLEAMEQSHDPTQALESAADQLQGMGRTLFRWEELARAAGVLTALLVPIGVARAWDARTLRTVLAGVLGGLLATGAVKVAILSRRSGAPGPDLEVTVITVVVAAAGSAGLCLGDRLEARLARGLARRLGGDDP